MQIPCNGLILISVRQHRCHCMIRLWAIKNTHAWVTQCQFARVGNGCQNHYADVIMGAITSQITSLTSVYSTVYSSLDHRKHQSSAPLAFVRGIHRDRCIPHTKCFHLMKSSCMVSILTDRAKRVSMVRNIWMAIYCISNIINRILLFYT